MRRSSSVALFVLVAAELSSTTTAFTTNNVQIKRTITPNRSIHKSFIAGRPHVATTISSAVRYRKSSSGLKMMNPGALAAVAGALTGGVFSGGLHAIAGPDHLAALLPRCVGQRWYRACRVGALWGIGHGISATLMGVLAYLAKSRINFKSLGFMSRAELVLEVAVGLSLVIIGAMGMKEAREWEEENSSIIPRTLGSAANEAAGVKPRKKRAVIFNGLLHGFSWDGAPSLAPALAVATWRDNLAFLLAYGIGTIGMMTIATSVIGEGTSRAGKAFNRPDIPQKLSYFSSIIAVVIGAVWCGLAFV